MLDCLLHIYIFIYIYKYIYIYIYTHQSYLWCILFTDVLNLHTPGPGSLRQEWLPALISWAQIAPDMGDLPGAEFGCPRLTPCKRRWSVSAPCSSCSSLSLFWDVWAVPHCLPVFCEQKGKSWLRSSIHPRVSKCALMPGVGITGQIWLNSAAAKMKTTLNCECSFTYKMSLVSFAFHTLYVCGSKED